jgi:hypothetical protein
MVVSFFVHAYIEKTPVKINSLILTASVRTFSNVKPHSSPMRITEAFIRTLPKVLLHDHLDGGLRPRTIIELAKEQGYAGLPTINPDALAHWFHRGARRGSLPLYLEGFAHTTAVMQTEEALERVAYEMMEDMHHDGVVYVETRFAPVFHTEKGLHWDDVVNAVLRGLERGKKEFGVEYGVIICAMRNMKLSLEMAELAVDFRERGVVGFDLAGEEGGYPPKNMSMRSITSSGRISTSPSMPGSIRKEKASGRRPNGGRPPHRSPPV